MTRETISIAEEIKKDSLNKPANANDDVAGVRGPQSNDKDAPAENAPSPTNWNRYSVEPAPHEPANRK